MDIRLSGATPSAAEREAIDSVLPPHPVTNARVGRRLGTSRSRELLLPSLHAIQDRVGWISRGSVDLLAERLSIAPAEIYGVASFYHLLATEPTPALVVHVCDDVACLANGAAALLHRLEAMVGPAGGNAAGSATWETSPCLGQCNRAPAALIRRSGAAVDRSDLVAGPVAADEVAAWLTGTQPSDGPDVPLPQAAAPMRLLARASRGPLRFADYVAAGGTSGLRRALELGAAGVIAEVARAKLSGRGGAGFPLARKWQTVAEASEGTHYVVCNADESEPGTFKDRVLLERDPFGVLEGLAIAGIATGSSRGFIYIRDEYPLARSRIEQAIAEVGGQFQIEIALHRGAGAYICGEETALLNSIEGRRGDPRNRPPFPATHGLFGRPTAVNNVETLLCAVEVLQAGAESYLRAGTEQSPGTKLFSVSGSVARPGVYEVEFGTTLGEVVDLAGGPEGDRRLQAILLGGAAGSFVGADRLDLPLTPEAAREAGLSLGSGSIVVFDDSVDLRQIVLRIARFFRQESCGQCVPCRVGTIRQEEALARILRDRPLGSRDQELELLEEIAQTMRDASICGLGQTASTAVQSGLLRLVVR